MKITLKSKLAITSFLMASVSAQAQLLFTQYYEGPSTNKWIEIKNIGSTSVNLTTYSLSIYTNAAAENWKSGTAGSNTLALTGSLAAGSVYLLGNTGNTSPTYAVTNTNATSNTVINFNGNDSIVLWNDSVAFSTSQITDVLAFTNSGNEGVDKSFVRTGTSIGYNLTAGSNITNFSGVWSNTTNAVVIAALAGTDSYLGSSTVSAVPEPSTAAALLGFAALAGTAGLRRRRA